MVSVDLFSHVLWAVLLVQIVNPGSCLRQRIWPPAPTSTINGSETVIDADKQIEELLRQTVLGAISSLNLSAEAAGSTSFEVTSEGPLEEEGEGMETCTDHASSIGHAFEIVVRWGKSVNVSVNCLEMLLTAPSVDTAECAKLWRTGCPYTSFGTVMFGCHNEIGWVGSRDLDNPCGLRMIQLAKIVEAVATMLDTVHTKHSFLFPVWTLGDSAKAACYYQHDGSEEIEYTEYGYMSPITALKYGKLFYEQYFGFQYVDMQDPLHKKLQTTENIVGAWKRLGEMTVAELKECAAGDVASEVIDSYLAFSECTHCDVRVKDLASKVLAHGQKQSAPVRHEECETVRDFYEKVVLAHGLDRAKCLGSAEFNLTGTTSMRLAEGWPLRAAGAAGR